MPKIECSEHKMGSRWTKPDIERIGLFVEMGFMSAKTNKPKKLPPDGKNLYCEGQKTKNGTQHGYFEPIFKRIYSKEALPERGRKPKPSFFKNVSGPFMPPIGHKLHSSPGDYYGCFSGNIEAFSNQRRKKPPYKAPPPNFYTSPAKKGGPGYIAITLGKYPEYKSSRYGLKANYKQYGKNIGNALVTMNYPQPFFDKNPFKEPANIKEGPTYVRPKDALVKVLPPGYIVPPGIGKLKGGCQAGGFEKFPEFISNRNIKLEKKKTPTEKIFYPSFAQPKSFYNTSIVNHNVDFRLNGVNVNTFEPVYIKQLTNE